MDWENLGKNHEKITGDTDFPMIFPWFSHGFPIHCPSLAGGFCHIMDFRDGLWCGDHPQ